MRPIDKGDTPQLDNKEKTVSDYKDWRQDLLDRIGNYCAYCNMVLTDGPQVEHVAPKVINPQLRLKWSNMLLACGACNRAKSAWPYESNTHYLPDYHNTYLAFDHVIVPHPKKKNLMACVPVPKNINLVNIEKAANTIELFKFNAITSNPRATDLRWKYRFEAYQSSRLWRDSWDNWGKDVPDAFVPLLLDAALGKGFFSIWFECFHNVTIVKRNLIEAFPGTRLDCFSEADNYEPIALHQDDL